MKFYDKYFKNNYEELITYYPRFYRDVFEMVEILKANGRISDRLEEDIEQAYLNCFIEYADEATITKLEKFLMIGLNKSRTLEERRRLVKSYFVGFGKVSAAMLEEMITSYTNAPVRSRFEPFDEEGNNRLYIEFERGKEPTLYMSDIMLLLSKKLPAHIDYQAAVVYRFSVGIGRRRSYHRYGYELTGTKPDTALIGVNFIRDSITRQEHQNRIIQHRAASEGEATGLYPDTALLGFNYISESVTEERHESTSYGQRQADKESEFAGTWPRAALIGRSVIRQTGAGAEADSYATDFELTGKTPETTLIASELARRAAVMARVESFTHEHEKAAENAHTGAEPVQVMLGKNTEINAAAEVATAEYSVDYTPCGTTFTQS